ncbi:MAG TPA: hypothetical protein VGS61_04405, partial [Acidimicrobiales bacterium]|nr:hypothetical protein [Acidimicrobiales bacterium]
VVHNLEALEGDARRRAFFSVWARHEAAVKCRGRSVASDAGARRGLLEREVAVGDGYAGAVALDPGPEGPRSMALSVEPWLWRPGGGARA